MRRIRRIMIRTTTPALIVLAVLATARPAAAEAVISSGTLQVKFNAQDRTFEVTDTQAGPILRQGVILSKAGGRRGLKAEVDEVDGRKELVLRLGEAWSVRVRVPDDGQVELRTEGRPDGPVGCRARAVMGRRPMVALLADQQPEDRGVLVTRCGPAEVAGARSLLDPRRDLAVTATSPGGANWRHEEGWQLQAEAPGGGLLLKLDIQRHYYRDRLGIEYFAPIRKQRRWPTAPVVAMTWYGIEGWKGQPAQRKEWLYPNIDWVAEHLLPYAGDNLVFQLDDNYAFDDDGYMRELSDYIRSKGLVPGIWFTPYAVAPQKTAEQHPDWFLHDADGKPLSAFGGVNWGWKGKLGNRAYVLNVTRPEAVEHSYGMFWHKASETWNFDFFKIDGQPQVVDGYRKSVDGQGAEGYRRGLGIGRSIVGPEKFINACWGGPPLEAVGLVDGSRTGGDTGNKPHAIDVVLRWNFLNNVCWWSDPDAAANLYKATAERARLNAQARVLTGQQFLTDDVWTDVPPPIRRIWQHSFPTLDVRPANLYKIDNWRAYDLFDLRVARPWGAWDVVGLFNYEAEPVEKVLDLGRLLLEAERVHVFEYWESQYLGTFPRDAKIARRLAEFEGEVFAIVPAVADRPLLISTSRHVTQGALELEQLVWEEETPGDGAKGPRWVATGTSSRLVGGDPYELVFVTGRYRLASAKSSAPARINHDGGLLRVQIVPEQSGSVEWKIAFEPITTARLGVSATTLDVEQGAGARFDLRSLGPEGVDFKVDCSEPGVKVSAAEGRLGPWPQQAMITVATDGLKLKPGAAVRVPLIVTAQGSKQPPQKVELRVRAPLPKKPENLALRAKATASSTWGPGYAASRANDGDQTTRWNSRDGDKDGCWLELTWPQPVEFDWVEIDECVDHGPRIESWQLEAGTGGPAEIARGAGAGRRRAVKLPQPVKATKLRLTIEKASVVPTIWELRVYRGP